MSRDQFAKNLWRWSAGLEELDVRPTDEERRLAENLCPWTRPDRGGVDVQELELTEWSPEFERLMRNRMIVGSYRYGRIGAEGKPQYSRVDSIIVRADLYRRTGNVDLLVDVANLALLEFVEGRHPTRHMEAEKHVESVAKVSVDEWIAELNKE